MLTSINWSPICTLSFISWLLSYLISRLESWSSPELLTASDNTNMKTSKHSSKCLKHLVWALQMTLTHASIKQERRRVIDRRLLRTSATSKDFIKYPSNSWRVKTLSNSPMIQRSTRMFLGTSWWHSFSSKNTGLNTWRRYSAAGRQRSPSMKKVVRISLNFPKVTWLRWHVDIWDYLIGYKRRGYQGCWESLDSSQCFKIDQINITIINWIS